MPENDIPKINPPALTEKDIEAEISKMELPSNSKRNSEKKLSKVIQGKASPRKNSLGRKIGETFLAEDIHQVREYVLFDVVIPAIKDTFVNVIVNGVNALIYGDTRVSNSRFNAPYGNRSTTHTSYSSISRKPDPLAYNRPYRTRGYSDGDRKPPEVVDTRYDAELVIDSLNDCLNEYGRATVGDFYDLVGYDTENTDYKWGWTDLSTARVRKVSGGWLIDLPRPRAL